jgi:hypothetical protein
MVRRNYTSSIATISGNSSAPLVVKSYPGETPWLRYSQCGTYCINTLSQSYVMIDGLQLTDGLRIGGSTWNNITIRRVYGGPAGFQGLGPSTGGSNNLIEDSVFANNYFYTEASGTGPEAGLYVGCYGTGCSNWIIRRNIAFNNAWDGFHWNGAADHLTITQNISHSNGISGFSFQSGVRDSVITSNVAFNNATYAMGFYQYKDNDSICGAAPCGTGATTGNLIENNTLVAFNSSNNYALMFSNTTDTRVNNGWTTNGPYFEMGHNTVRNNIIQNVGGGRAPILYWTYPKALGISYLATSTFEHNLTNQYSGGTGVFRIYDGTETEYNCTTVQGVLTTGSVTNCLSGLPKFLGPYTSYPAYDLTPYDFRIPNTSPAFHAGTPTGAPTFDLWGYPFASSPSAGAIEVVGSGTVTPPTVSITSPVANSTLSGAVTLSATASGSAAIGSVQFQADGANVGAAVTAGPTYSTSWDTTALPNGTHSVSAVAKDVYGNTGTASVTVTVSNVAVAPVISAISAVQITASTASIVWSTDKLSTSQVSYGTTTAYGSTTALDSNLITSHAVALSGLAASTTYHYRVLSRDSNGNLTTSADATFTTAAATTSGGGWLDLPNTRLQSVCPANNFNGIPYDFANLCRYAVTAWNGAVADTKRNRMIIWGGGHEDYSGNEVYALNLGSGTPTMTRLTDPTDFTSNPSCSDINVVDGSPVSRHTYSGLAYVPTQDKMYAFGGAPAPCAGWSKRTYMLDLSQAKPKWTAMDPVGGFDLNSVYWSGSSVCEYDPNTQSVICAGGGSLALRYDPATNTYTKLSSTHIPYAATGAIDPKRKLFIFMGAEYSTAGPHVYAMDLSSGSSYVAQDWTSQVTGCAGLASASYPGLTYDSALDKIVGWPNAGNTVYLFDPDKKTCTTQTFPNGPANTLDSVTGTFGRFRYFPGLNKYGLVSLATLNAYTLTMSDAAGVPAPTTTSNACDLNLDGAVNGADVQLAINQALGVTACGTASLHLAGVCDVITVQRVIIAANGGACISSK